MSLIEKSQDDIITYLKSIDILTVCRACLSHQINMFPLVSSCGNQLTSNDSQFFNQYLEIQINDDEKMPHKVCDACADKISMMFKFKRQCKKASEILHKFVKSQLNSDCEDFKFDNKQEDSETSINEIFSKKIKKVKSKNKRKQKDDSIKTDDICLPLKTEAISNCDDSMDSNEVIDYTVCVQSDIQNKDIPISNDNKIESVNKTPDCDNALKNVSHISPNFNQISQVFETKDESKNTENSKEIEKFDSSQNSLHNCSTCGDSFSTARGLHIHAHIHTQSESLLCSACGQSFSDSRSLREHSLSHTGDKPFKCSYCDRKFAQKKPLQYHEKTHTGERPYVCDLCGKSYIQPNNFVIHRRTHTGEKPFVCKECGKAFTNGASLSLHMPVHTGVKNFVCTICGKRMARSGELTIHMRTHTGEKPYVCRTCSKAFIKKSSLQAHMYSHTGEKKFVCPTCGHRVAHAGKLTVHMRTHSNNKPFACPVCDRRFANQGYLKQHSKIHFGDRSKPFTCSECGKAFVKNRNLTEHMRTHTGERPYKCLECNHGFSQKSTLNYHVKKTHGKLKLEAEATVKLNKLKIVNKEESRVIREADVKLESDHKNEDAKNYTTSSDNGLFPSVMSAQPCDTKNSVNRREGVDTDAKSNFDPRIHFDSRTLGFPPYQL
ncbi:uncharacterized protein LOC143911957 [Arctopsyche grandis]|uniref:uncharacterized protein LOC143911957 n=1 Tax=Arctopsyche grandis TaxID=121162 RepID=UPI00406D8E5E